MVKHLTARGEPIDMGALIAQNETVKALGNAKMNARGDRIDEKGIVLKTQEQIESEWAAEKAKQKLLSGQPRNIKDPLPNMINPTAAPPQKRIAEDKDFEPMMNPTAGRPDVVQPAPANPGPVPTVTITGKPPRRKMTETDK
jgi:hypothetical protein